MTVTRASIVTRLDENKYRVKIASLSAKEVDAYVCALPGIATAYKENQAVYVAWLDNTDWVILGTVTSEKNSISSLSVDYLTNSAGELSSKTQISGTNLTLGDLVNMCRAFSLFTQSGGQK